MLVWRGSNLQLISMQITKEQWHELILNIIDISGPLMIGLLNYRRINAHCFYLITDLKRTK